MSSIYWLSCQNPPLSPPTWYIKCNILTQMRLSGEIKGVQKWCLHFIPPGDTLSHVRQVHFPRRHFITCTAGTLSLEILHMYGRYFFPDTLPHVRQVHILWRQFITCTAGTLSLEILYHMYGRYTFPGDTSSHVRQPAGTLSPEILYQMCGRYTFPRDT